MAKSVDKMACSIKFIVVLYCSVDNDCTTNDYNDATVVVKGLHYLKDVVGFFSKNHNALVQMVMFHC